MQNNLFSCESAGSKASGLVCVFVWDVAVVVVVMSNNRRRDIIWGIIFFNEDVREWLTGPVNVLGKKTIIDIQSRISPILMDIISIYNGDLSGLKLTSERLSIPHIFEDGTVCPLKANWKSVQFK